MEVRGSTPRGTTFFMPGGIAQLVEHMLCKHGVRSSNLLISTKIERLSASRWAIFVYGGPKASFRAAGNKQRPNGSKAAEAVLSL